MAATIIPLVCLAVIVFVLWVAIRANIEARRHPYRVESTTRTEAERRRIAESLRMAVSDFRFAWEGKIFAVGVSIGMLSFKNDGLELADLLSDVDSACYMAKEKGRNRIHVYRSQDSQLLMRKGQMNWVATN